MPGGDFCETSPTGAQETLKIRRTQPTCAVDTRPTSNGTDGRNLLVACYVEPIADTMIECSKRRRARERKRSPCPGHSRCRHKMFHRTISNGRGKVSKRVARIAISAHMSVVPVCLQLVGRSEQRIYLTMPLVYSSLSFK